MTGMDADILIGSAATVLKPIQRYYAMRGRGQDSSLFYEPWVQIGLGITVAVLILAVVISRIIRERRAVRADQRHFDEMCYRCGLTPEDIKFFMPIVKRSGLKRSGMIFTLPDAFEKGVRRVMEEAAASEINATQRKAMYVRINTIKEKLGFKSRLSLHGIRRARGQGLSSRGLAAGRHVTVLKSSRAGAERSKAVVEENNEFELVLVPEFPVQCRAGELWNVQYGSGGGLWEFDSVVIGYESGRLTLNHSEQVRFMNRRRFLRVPVSKPGLIAIFPGVTRDVQRGRIGMAPKFFHARVTELSGPGVRVESRLEVKPDERVLVVFELEPGRIVEDVGQVRSVQEQEGTQRYLIGVELVGLNDAGVDELVKATNAAALGMAMQETTARHAAEFAADSPINKEKETEVVPS